MSLSISTGGPVQGENNIPSSSEMNAYKEGIQGKDPKELINDLNKPGLEPWKKDAIVSELASQAQKNQQSQGAGGAGGGGDSQEDIQKLLKKLMDGSISAEEMQKLAGMLGVKPDDLEAMKGKGAGAGDGGDSGGDIQGG